MVTIKDMANGYNTAFSKYPPLVCTDRWLYGVWMIGNDYRNKSSLYGAYPPSYVDRVMSMYPDGLRILHLFSGKLPKGNYIRFDIQEEAEVNGDAKELSSYFSAESIDLILADPPYTKSDAARYGVSLVNKKQVLHECHKVLKPNGHLVWLDTSLPMYRKTEFSLIGTIGLVRSTNHRFRSVSIFERKSN